MQKLVHRVGGKHPVLRLAKLLPPLSLHQKALPVHSPLFCKLTGFFFSRMAGVEVKAAATETDPGFQGLPNFKMPFNKDPLYNPHIRW